MALSSGSRFGPYEIGPALGAGGMGEVYRATDTRLKREVAIKVLPATLAGDPERLARFQREAEVLAALNHPHIAAIYGLEDKDGVTALVMELVDGTDLSRLIPPGGLPVAEALAIAKQIAEALEAAHEQGIIHRDLKPANVKVKADGTVKVLDFGLAKALDQESEFRNQGSADLVNSPTITSPAMTMRGVILGTAAYMSPEQARGRVVDKRTDIWAFGAVLYEVLTGKRAFEGEDVSLTLASVMKSDPDFGALPADLPPGIRACLVRCLQKDPRQRLRDIGDMRLAFDGAFGTDVSTSAAPAAPARPLWRRLLGPAAAAVVAGLTGFVGWSVRPPDPRPVTRFEHLLPGQITFRGSTRRTFAVSPDGRRIAYAALDGLYLHALDEFGDKRLVESQLSIQNPTFSPDGESVAYNQSGQLKRIAIASGAPVVIADSQNPIGISWGDDDALWYALADGISRVPALGGAPELVVKATDGEVLSNPQLLPGGDAILFSSAPATLGASTVNQRESLAVVHSQRSGERKVLVRGAGDARYLPSGHLLYTVGDGLFGVGFDLPALQVKGGAVSLVQGIRRGAGTTVSLADFDVSLNGALVYVGGTTGYSGSQLAWLDRAGRPEVIASIPPQEFLNPRLSDDERRVLVVAQGDVRIYDLATGRESRVTSDGTAGAYADWVPGERAVVYSSTRKGEGGLMNIWLQPLDGSGRATQLTKLEGQMHFDASSPDGRNLVAHRHPLTGAAAGQDLFVIPVQDGAAAEPKPFVAGTQSEEDGVFSPDGRFVAYRNNVSGRSELVIRPFPGPGAETTVSVGGAREPAWARNGELFYRRGTDDMLMAVRVVTSPSLSVGPPKELFRGSGQTGGSARATYAVNSDGQRFLMSGVRAGSGLGGDAAAPRPRFTIVLNWVEELKQRIPRD